MKIALIGATGFVGAAVLAELLKRGHHIIALARNPGRLHPQPRLETRVLDACDPDAVTDAVRGADAVISAFNPGWDAPDLYERFMRGSRAIERGVAAASVKRLLVVGGAGSLFVAPGMQLVDTPDFIDHVPPNILPGARGARDALNELRENRILDWTFLSPPALMRPGSDIAPTGRYRVGADDLLMKDGAPAGIAVEDLAVAIVDEIEQPQHVRTRFTVAAA